MQNCTRVAEELNVGVSTVSRVLKSYRERKTIQPKKRGKPVGTRVLNEETINIIRNKVKNNPYKTFTDIGKENNVSRFQVMRRAKEVKISKFRTAFKVALTPEHIEERLEISQENLNLPDDTWNRTI